ncbi:MAG: hypothetical protein P1P88_16815 [Bacteroidales bacterium]|nr:hypothetical protein [Bacteroidales bacterium]
MIENYKIILGKGIGNILLGMKKEQVENILGQPDDMEEIDYDDGEKSLTYYYYDLALDLTFESDDDDRLSFISVENDEFSIENKIKVGQSKDVVLKACKELAFGEPEIEDLSSEDIPNQELIALENENVNFWFTDDTLDEIQIGPFWKDDETPIWPV